jgi:SAM-dependent methyltransferase
MEINDNSIYWNKIYLENINTVWGGADPDETMRKVIRDTLSGLNKKSIRVLDIGCGNGRNSLIFNDLPEFIFDYSGLDFAPAAIDYCKKTYPMHNFFQVDISSIILNQDKKYDIIIDFGCFHCLQPEKRSIYADNIKRVSTNDTVFIMRAWYGNEVKAGLGPDFTTLLFLNVWFVNIQDIQNFFCPPFHLDHYFFENKPPYDINNGMVFFILTQNKTLKSS